MQRRQNSVIDHSRGGRPQTLTPDPFQMWPSLRKPHVGGDQQNTCRLHQLDQREGRARAQAPLNADNFILRIIWDKSCLDFQTEERERAGDSKERLGPLLKWRQVIRRTLGQQLFQHKVSLIGVSTTRVLAQTSNQRPQIEAFAGNYRDE